MKLNGICCGGFTMPMKDVVEFSLSDTTIEEVGALSGQDLSLCEDDATPVASFAGYAVTAVYVSGASVRMRAARQLDADSKKAIEALEENLATIGSRTSALDASLKAEAATLGATDADLLQAVGELGVDVAEAQATTADVLQAVGELGAMFAALAEPAA